MTDIDQSSRKRSEPVCRRGLDPEVVVRSKDRPSPFFEAARVSSVGLEMSIATGIGWGLGYWLDDKFSTGPWLMLVGLLLGVAAGFNGLLRTAKEINANAAASRLGDTP